MALPKDSNQHEEYRRKQSESHKGQVPHNKGKAGTYRHSDETRAKMSAAKKGKAPAHLAGKPSWNKGKPMSDEQKAKLVAAKKGSKASPETRAKMSASHKARYANGYSMSEEARQKAGAAHKNKEVSPETREKLSRAGKGRVSNRKGVTLGEETLRKMSKVGLERWERKSPEEKAKHADILRESTRDITDSWIENVCASRLDAQGITYERQQRIGWYRVDFFIPAENRVVEVNGCFWHGCEQCEAKGRHLREDYEEKRAKDAKRYDYLRRKGYTVDIVWEHELPRKR